MTLGEAFATVTGNTPPKNNADFYGDFIPLVKPPELCDVPFDSAEDGLSESGAAIARTLPPRSILVSCIGNLGKIGLNTVPVAFNQQINAILPDERQAIPEFMFFQVLSPTFKEQLESLASGTTVPIVNKSKFNSIGIVLPALSEQRRIVGILDEAFEGLATAKANAEQNLQNARALFESHLQAVFTQRGDGWVEKQLGDICDRVSVGHVGETSKFYCEAEDGIPFLRSQNVRRGFIDLDGIRHITKAFHQKLKKSQLRPGDLLFVRVGANRGDCSFLPNDLGEINCANIVFARPTDGNAEYLSRYCQSPDGRSQLLGMSVGSAQGVINTSSVAELVVPSPSIREQLRIVELLNLVEEETQRLESLYQRKLAALDELKKSLLHRAFSGQLTSGTVSQEVTS